MCGIPFSFLFFFLSFFPTRGCHRIHKFAFFTTNRTSNLSIKLGVHFLEEGLVQPKGVGKGKEKRRVKELEADNQALLVKLEKQSCFVRHDVREVIFISV